MLREDNDWDIAKYSEIIKFIKDNYHSFFEKELPITEGLVHKILRVHYSDCGEVLSGVHKLFGKLKNELELVFVKKQVSLFPDILDYQMETSKELLEEITTEIVSLEKEYDVIVQVLRELRRVTDDYTVPPSGCPTFELTYKKLQELELNILKNIHLEKDIMYGRLRA